LNGARVLPLLAAFAAAAAGADPSAELARTAAYFRDGKAHAAEFVQTFTPSGFTKSRRETGSVIVQAPDSLRFDYDAPKKTFAFDGRVARFYSPADRQMTVRTLSEADRAQLPLIFLQTPEDLARRNKLEAEASAGGTTVLVTPRDSESEIAWIRLILTSEGVPRGLSFQTSAGDRTEFQFAGFRSEPPKAPSEFVLHPPAGTRIIENEP
jgi:outer membrane lipoprotein-sorting protein